MMQLISAIGLQSHALSLMIELYLYFLRLKQKLPGNKNLRRRKNLQRFMIVIKNNCTLHRFKKKGPSVETDWPLTIACHMKKS
jgi:hypothetical protein